MGKGWSHKPETIERIRQGAIKRVAEGRGFKSHTPEAIERIRQSAIKRYAEGRGFKSHKPEVIERIRQKALQQHAEGRANYTGINSRAAQLKSALSRRGMKRSESHVKAMSDARIGVPKNKEHVETWRLNQYEIPQGPNASKLTRHQAWEIRFKLMPAGISTNDIASHYGLHPKTIRNLAAGRSWKFLKEDDYKK